MARKLGANPIIAVDISNERLKLAKSFGADITVNLTLESIADVIANHCGGTIDYAVEACGSPTVLNDILGFLRPQGGKVVVIGNAAHGSAVTIPSVEFNMGKSILGTWGGTPNRIKIFLATKKKLSKKVRFLGN